MPTPGTIVLISGEMARYADCLHSVMALEKPEGTLLTWERSCDIVGNLNRGVRKMRGDWVWIMGDDHIMPPDLLMRLLKHDVDFVAPLVCKRAYPFQTVAYDHEVRPGLWRPTLRTDIPPTGLWKVDASTNAGLLIRKRVLDAIGDPWFKHTGAVEGQIAEDVTFWKEAHALGFKGYIDVDAQLGHMTPMVVWPGKPGTPTVELEVGAGMRLPISFTREEVRDADGTLLREQGAR